MQLEAGDSGCSCFCLDGRREGAWRDHVHRKSIGSGEVAHVVSHDGFVPSRDGQFQDEFITRVDDLPVAAAKRPFKPPGAYPTILAW